MPAILTEAQICLAYDMEVVAEALASGYVLPPDPRNANYAAQPPKLATENEMTYRDRVEAWQTDDLVQSAIVAAMARAEQVPSTASLVETLVQEGWKDWDNSHDNIVVSDLHHSEAFPPTTGSAAAVEPSTPFPGKDVYGAD